MEDLEDDTNNNFSWGFMKGKFSDILGDDLLDEITSIFPKRTPNTDMYRTDDEIVVAVEMPGITSTEGISIRLKGLKLSISGEVPCNYGVDEEDLIQSERFFGEFKKELQLPDDITPGEIIKAFFKHGLLEIHISITPANPDRDIEVEFKE